MDHERKLSSLRRLLVQFLGSLIGLLTLAILLPSLLLFVAQGSGGLTAANQGEKDARYLLERVKKQQAFSLQEVSSLNQYALLDSQLKVKATNMDQGTLKQAQKFVQGQDARGHYFIQTKFQKQRLLLAYQLRTSYRKASWNHYLPTPFQVWVISMIIGLLGACLFCVQKFARKIGRELEPLNQAVEKIQAADLNFAVGQSSIKEFQEVLTSLAAIKENLQADLNLRYRAEQKYRQQLAALVHDLKTPLTGALGWTDLLQETELDEEQKSYLRHLQQNKLTISQLINSLLQVTLTTKAETVHLKECNLHDLGNELLAQMQELATPQKIQINYQEDWENPQLVTDPSLLKQALLNVITNAIEFTPQGGKITWQMQRKENLRIVITDSGPGFSPAALKQAGEELYRGDLSRSGTGHFGLGLAIARLNLELLGGKLTWENTSAQGSARVTLTLPPTTKTYNN
ncbi:HAMP domain-containing histidine kinase [Lactobacillus sp. DCY120]|uniref:histidine kinase n=1 Tax=Bombilactobacillus apium TaxID=2675299 RepID=A0A850QYZ2_9LACO|nr:HAMP domain-containing sensor histidine kinase [Bombilactobacillus apium]NVY95969.1 HAMP domain-containing histidine kinase [Bombilactobacillus apium]